MSAVCKRCYKIVDDPCRNDTETYDCKQLERLGRSDPGYWIRLYNEGRIDAGYMHHHIRKINRRKR